MGRKLSIFLTEMRGNERWIRIIKENILCYEEIEKN